MTSEKKCCVPFCNSQQRPLHKFPNPDKDPDRFQTWLYKIGGDILSLQISKIFKCRRVCHLHFETKFHTRSELLSPDAVPTLNLSGLTERRLPLANISNPIASSSSKEPDTTSSTSANVVPNIEIIPPEQPKPVIETHTAISSSRAVLSSNIVPKTEGVSPQQAKASDEVEQNKHTTNTIKSVVYRTYSSQNELPNFETLAVSEPKKYVFHVALNRPKKLNTFSHNMWSELKECFTSLNDNPKCRVVVLSGEGKHFTGGIDSKSFMQNAADAGDLDDVARKARFLHHMIKTYQDGITSLEECIKPSLVVTHNACVGAGVDLITAADISVFGCLNTTPNCEYTFFKFPNNIERYCTEDAWFQVKEVDISLAADVGTLQRLPKVIGSASIARELCFTARKLHAQEALQIGLVSKVFPDKETAIKEVLTVAEDIASKSPVAVQTTKQSLVYSQSRTTEEGIRHIRLLNQLMLQSEDVPKAAMAAVSKGDDVPEFHNL